MKNKFVACTVLSVGLAGAASAEGLSFGVDAALGGWWNTNKGAGFVASCGICDAQERLTGKLGFSVAQDFGGFTGQIDLGFQHIAPAKPPAYTDDGTNRTGDIALRLMRDFGDVRAGLFLGYGEHDDYGDSDENMTYRFGGVDFAMPTGFGSVFGQVGGLDSEDEYDEGPKDALFLRLGGHYAVGDDLVLTGAISTSGGYKDGEPDYENRTLALEFGVEKALADGLSVYGSFEYTRMTSIYTPTNTTYGDIFGTVWVGLKYDFGGSAKRGEKLPNIGQWVAYNANEIE